MDKELLELVRELKEMLPLCFSDVMTDAEWEESKHPRDDDGKFSSQHGGEGNSEEKSRSSETSGEERTFTKSDFLAMKEEAADLIDDLGWDYEHVGIRIQEEDTEKVGETMEHHSRNWGGDFGDDIEEAEELDGVSTVDVNSIGQMPGSGGYFRKVAYILAGNDGEYGYDPGEYIIKDPVVAAKFIFKDGKPVMIEKIE